MHEANGQDASQGDEEVKIQEACTQGLTALSCYTKGSAPPLAPRTLEDFKRLMPYMKKTIAYHNGDQCLVRRYLQERLPCAMGCHILTDLAAMRNHFGFDAPLYRSLPHPPPMVGVFTRVPVRVGRDDVELCIYNMIAPDLCAYADGSPTADLRALLANAGNALSTDDLLYEAARMHAIAWYLAFAAAKDHGFKKLSDVVVGGGAFVPEEWHDRFKSRVHDVAMYLIGYGSATFAFPEVELVPPPPRVPLRNATGWKDVLHVNAWCHSSFLGNGNKVDSTLDGAWGRKTPFALFAWPLANPWLALRAVDHVPVPPKTRPPDRLCGKPPQFLRRMREKR